MRREEEGNPRVAFKIAAVTPAGSTLSVWAVYKGNRVTVVPAGEQFDVRANFSAQNPGNWVTDYWRCLVTVISPDGFMAAYKSQTGVGSEMVGNNVLIDSWVMGNKFIMPSSGITFRVKLWANDDATGNVPSTSLW